MKLSIGSAFFSLSIITIGLICYLLVFYFVFPILGPDSGFYLAVARMMYSGKVFFTEIAVPYNPLAISAVGLPYLFTEQPDYRWSLFINVLFIIGSSVLLFNLIQRFKNNSLILNRFISLFFILLCLSFDGSHILLEPISVFLQLSALSTYIHYRQQWHFSLLLFSGIFIGLSFLAKQFGLFLLFPIGIDILIRRNNFIKEGFLLVLGVILAPGLLFFYYYTKGVDIGVYLQYILGRGMQLDVGNGTGFTYNFKELLLTLINFGLFNSYLLVLPLLLFFYRNKIDRSSILFLILPVFSMMVLYFAYYSHYFLYIIPYCLITATYLIDLTESKKLKYAVVFFFTFSLIFLSYHTFLDVKKRPSLCESQRESIGILKEQIAPHSQVFLSGPTQAYYALGTFNSIKLDEIGFAFPSFLYTETIMKHLNSGNYLILSPKKLQSYKPYLHEFEKKEIVLEGKLYYVLKKK